MLVFLFAQMHFCPSSLFFANLSTLFRNLLFDMWYKETHFRINDKTFMLHSFFLKISSQRSLFIDLTSISFLRVLKSFFYDLVEISLFWLFFFVFVEHKNILLATIQLLYLPDNKNLEIRVNQSQLMLYLYK